MDDLQRIYKRFTDTGDFAGCDSKKKYGQEYRQKIQELEVGAELMNEINAFQRDSVEEAFLDGVRFGMKFLMECMLNV